MPRTPHASPQTLRLFEALMKDPTTRRYGYELSRETGLASGTLYPILMRLTEQALLEADWEPSDQPGRPPRHLYRLTGDGVALAKVRLADAAARSSTAAAKRSTATAKPSAAATRSSAPAAKSGTASIRGRAIGWTGMRPA